MTDRYITPFPLPTPHERELLEILIEECAEVTQRATKALRFGLAEMQPGQGKTNAERLANELGDLREVEGRLLDIGVVQTSHLVDGMVSKKHQLAKYMQTTPGTRQ